uniref:Secreted protein n=1 Tax=Panagrellus redivivus TaxID=6233 RepID=A0A7E4UM92_PANRE
MSSQCAHLHPLRLLLTGSSPTATTDRGGSFSPGYGSSSPAAHRIVNWFAVSSCSLLLRDSSQQSSSCLYVSAFCQEAAV